MKVLAMDQAMKIPFKVSTTTSNFMIGVTAAASAGVYLHRGYIDPGLSMPVMLGVLGGSMVGARILVRRKQMAASDFQHRDRNSGNRNALPGSLGEGSDMQGEHAWTDKRIENILGNLLRAGVVFSAFIVFCGGFSLSRASRLCEPADYRVFQGEPSELRGVPGVVRDAMELSGRGIIQLGLLFLIATPVARVIFSIWGFAAERDRMYVVFTVIVLAILIFSLVGSSPM